PFPYTTLFRSSVGAKKQNPFIFICVKYSSGTILYRIIQHFIFYIFPATALPLGSLHIFEIFQDRDRKIAGTISLNESPRIVQNYLSPSDILHMFIFMIKHTF